MQKKSLSWFWALLFFGLGFRLLGSIFLVVPNFSPLMAMAVLGAVYLPRGWNLVLVPLILLLSEFIFLPLNKASDGSSFSSWFLISIFYYLLVALAGSSLSTFKSWGYFLGGSVLASIGFYVVANTFAWWGYQSQDVFSGYAPTLAGWWQANTTGLPGFIPSWYFLRNELLGDVVFVPLLLLLLDPACFGLGHRVKTAPHQA